MLRLDFISDINCPWCALGLVALEQALATLDGEIAVDLHFQPFELNPQLPAGGVRLADYLGQKYGMSPSQIAGIHGDIRARGAAIGFRFANREYIWNSFNAHRLLAWAEAEGGDNAQHRLKQALVQAYQGEGRNTDDTNVLLDVVNAAGLDAARAGQLLAGTDYVQAVRDAQAHWQAAGINAVPSLVINRRHLVQGAQSPAVYEQVLRDIARESASQNH